VSLEKAISELASAIRYAANRLAPGPPRPAAFTIKLISERRENDMDFLTYEADLPTVPDGTDMQEQRFSVVVDGGAPADQTLDKAATVATFEVPQGSAVDISLVYVDDAGNVSAPRTQAFTAVDTITPESPGDFGEVRVVSERTE
jgi:hypothetical protein